MKHETTTQPIAPEMTLADAARIAREEAAKHAGDVRSALTMLADSIYVTPSQALDFIGADGAEPETPDNRESHMSRPEAAYIMAKIATMRKLDVDTVIALQMGVKSLLKRHFDRQRNWAKRRAAKMAALPGKAAEPLTPEEELADTIARQKEAAE